MSVRGKPFEKGRSGNPGGRPKAYREVVAAARDKTTDAVETLAKIMGNTRAPAAARVAAAREILDRGWGKPTQAIDLDIETTPRDPKEMTDAEILAAIRANALTNLKQSARDDGTHTVQ